MKVKSLVFLAAIVGICSCFLKQEPPGHGSSPTNEPKVSGFIVLEELQGEQTAAGIAAVFAKSVSEKARQGFEFIVSPEYPIFGFKSVIPQRSPNCKIVRTPREDSGRGIELVSAGKLEFGTVLQETLMEIPEDNKHQYSRKLDWGIPAGVFAVRSSGSPDVGAFSANLSFPEALQEVRVGQGLAEDGVAIDRTQPMKVSWKAPVIPNSSNAIIIDVYADTATETVQMHCIGLENELLERGQLGWQIGTTYLSQLPPTNEGQLYVVRAHGFGYQRGNLTVEVQGARSFYSSAVIQ